MSDNVDVIYTNDADVNLTRLSSKQATFDEFFSDADEDDAASVAAVPSDTDAAADDPQLPPLTPQEQYLNNMQFALPQMPPMLPPKPAVYTPSELVQRRRLIIQIQNWQKSERLGKYVPPLPNLENLSIVELQNLLCDIKLIVEQRSSSKFVENGFVMGVKVIEELTKKSGFKTNGYTMVMQNNEEIMELVEEINLKRQDLTNISPEKRLLFLSAAILYQVHKINSDMAASAKKEVPAEVVNKSADL